MFTRELSSSHFSLSNKVSFETLCFGLVLTNSFVPCFFQINGEWKKVKVDHMHANLENTLKILQEFVKNIAQI